MVLALQMFDMELDLLRRCSVRLGKPNALHFMRIYTTAISLPSETHCLSKYLNEVALLFQKIFEAI